jgi:hypothetical protein
MPLKSVENYWQTGMEGKSGSASGSASLKEHEVHLVEEARGGKLDGLYEHVERLKAAESTVSTRDAARYDLEWKPRLEVLERELRAAESCVVSSARRVRLLMGRVLEMSFCEHDICLVRAHLLHRCDRSHLIDS